MKQSTKTLLVENSSYNFSPNNLSSFFGKPAAKFSVLNMTVVGIKMVLEYFVPLNIK